MNKVLSAPLKRAAKKVLVLGLALGLAVMAAVFLALAFFNVLVELFGAKSAAYAVTCLLCLVLAALCAWVVFKDGRKERRKELASDSGGPQPAVDPDSEEVD